MRAALELFSTGGYEATAIKDVTAQAGVAKGSFYSYFGSKQEVLLLINERLLESQLSELRQVATSSSDPSEKIRALVTRGLRGLPDHRSEMLIFVRERLALDDDSLRALTPKIEECTMIIAKIIDDGKARNEFSDSGSSRITALGIISMCTWAYEWFHEEGQYTTDDIAAWYSDLILRGLRPRPSLNLA
jgi:TetR/AcrR family transcriptional regulator, cholesterol catabolism regulator